MIRINLLPIRQFKRREAAKRQVTLYVLTVLLAIGASAFVYVNLNGQLNKLVADKDKLAAQEKALSQKVKEAQALEKQEKDLQAKLDIIADLENQRRGPVRILEEISLRLPQNRAWLVTLTQTGDKLSLKGLAMDNETIALFMSNLEDSNYFSQVELVRSAQEIQNQVRLKSFSVNCKIILEGENKEKSPDGGPAA